MLVEFNETGDGSNYICLGKKRIVKVPEIGIQRSGGKKAVLTDLSITMRAAVPSPVCACTNPSKSISTVSHTDLGMRGVDEPPGITASRLSQPPVTPPSWKTETD